MIAILFHSFPLLFSPLMVDLSLAAICICVSICVYLQLVVRPLQHLGVSCPRSPNAAEVAAGPKVREKFRCKKDAFYDEIWRRKSARYHGVCCFYHYFLFWSCFGGKNFNNGKKNLISKNAYWTIIFPIKFFGTWLQKLGIFVISYKFLRFWACEDDINRSTLVSVPGDYWSGWEPRCVIR